MKVEGGGGVATTTSAATTVLHKIKVKEEAKECCSNVLQQSSSSPPPSGRGASLAIGAIATITISSAAAGELVTTVAKQNSGNVTITQSTGNAEAFPVDLDLKSKVKNNISREKTSTRDDVNGTENQANSSSPSPSSSPGSHSHQSQINNNNNNVINKTQQQLRTTSSSSVRSPDSDADQNLSIQNLKAETDDPTSHRQDDNKCNIETNGTGARCISGIFGAHGKLKRLLGTLVQFAMDISPDTGDTVRTLVLGLLSGTMSAEEFHSALQEATNFPLRGFVLPYLKHTLPSLQRDLSAAARADNQTCAQYLRANESSVLEAVGLAPAGGDSVDPFAENAMPNHHYNMRPIGSSTSTTGLPTGLHSSATSHLGFAPGHAVKRRANDALYYENSTAFDEGPPYQKRSTNPWLQHHHQHQHHQQHIAHQQQHPSDVSYCWYTHPLHSSNSVHHAHGSSGSLIPSLVQIGNSQPGATNTSSYGTLQAHLSHQPAITTHGASSAASGAPMQNGSASLDDEWKNIHVMLNCILGMVEKTKRALAILQKRGCTSPAAATANPSNLQVPLANGGQVSNGTDNTVADGNFKRLSGDIVAQTIRATEDRVAEVKRRAEEAVLEVKRAAVAEVQRAVAAAVAESRANERLRSQRYIDSLPMTQQRGHTPQHGRPSPFLRLSESSTRAPTASSTTTNSTSTGACNDDVDKETHLPSGLNSNCWNCGRPALETCGGCGIARYCGSFCQHRDWEAGGHHANCANNSTSHHQQQQQQQQHHERARSSTPSPPRTGSTASGDSDATKSATLSTASVRSTK